MGNLTVSVDDLKGVSQRLITEKDELVSIYNNKVKSILEASKEAIVASSLDFNDVSQQFKSAFDNLASNLTDLSSALSTKIIPEYENLGSSIANAFNKDFADKMRDIFKTTS